MINFVKSIILSLLFVSCGTYIKYSDSLYSPVTRSGIYKPSGGSGSLMSDFQVERAQLRWFNYYHLNMPTHYYNPHFGNNWYLSNQWRFDNYWRVAPFRHAYIPTRRPATITRNKFRSPIRRNTPRRVPTIRRRIPRNNNVPRAISRTSGSTINLPSRIKPNNPIRRTNANPTRKNISNFRNSRSTNSRRQ